MNTTRTEVRHYLEMYTGKSIKGLPTMTGLVRMNGGPSFSDMRELYHLLGGKRVRLSHLSRAKLAHLIDELVFLSHYKKSFIKFAENILNRNFRWIHNGYDNRHYKYGRFIIRGCLDGGDIWGIDYKRSNGRKIGLVYCEVSGGWLQCKRYLRTKLRELN